ncbi:MBL fold metallo-hydrolase [Bacillus sp. FJAT-50079]|uniref:MBL fold metallo-hydrolase n=1 Tax=Bacillus sp. FJAT-50079 TaxID=2833577 RepID=UPI001BC992AE|nr:MBL fold metallo-hydrolase [Bacillus sp. FJAT-50079]MBS4207314.1 MBL fold metallo-hydrolase [Bacillus sp. FJAT-50079]
MDTLTFYGTSDAQGVPRLLCGCHVCKSVKPHNHRTRPSCEFNIDEQTFLIDISPDFRSQFQLYNNSHIPSTVLITHAHNDHVAGLGDFADLCYWNNKEVQIISPPDIINMLTNRFPYLVNRKGLTFVGTDQWANNGIKISFHRVNHGIKISFHRVNHGHNGYSYGILVAKENGYRWAYMSDSFDVLEDQWRPFYHLDLFIFGTSFWKENQPRWKRSVYDVTEAFDINRMIEPKKMILTHLSHDIDIKKRTRELPKNMMFASDGLKITLN